MIGESEQLVRAAMPELDVPAAALPGDRGGVRFTSNIVGPIYLAADFICLAAAIPIALAAYHVLIGARLVASVHLFALFMLSATYLLIRASKHAYQRSLADALEDEGSALFDAVVSSLIASALIWQFGMIDNYSRGISILYLLALCASLWLSRPLVRKLLRILAKRGVIGQRIAFYGAEPATAETIERLLASLDLPHLSIVGVADDRPRVDEVGDMHFIGGLAELTALARAGGVDHVFISVSDMNRERLTEIVEGLSEVSMDVSLIPPQAVALAPDYRVSLLGAIPVLTLWQRPFRDINQFVKRGEDLLLGALALILVSPILLVAAILIRLTSAGPALFIQPRMGFNNEVIRVVKFRSMFFDQSDEKGLVTTSKSDPRVTPVGRVLRKLSIDELPQLLNVLKGDMSLVGPRPHATHMRVGDRFYVDAVRGYAGRHRVKPGITGLAQVRGLRGEIRTIERAKRRVELDKEYIDQWSLWLDLKIMLATIPAVFLDEDAY
ncbi:MAG: exopolysaccharide biosynthesis polyprenyl glycosylphosphotransferase [Sphingomicrobium sp.]|nr:exopolysaccharide biosynthesis polyprenyl glycosylphosphotransferase [Sphingomonadales bacterium]